MKIIVCLDDNNGMLFNKRRQSRDEKILENIAELTNELWISPFSEKLFTSMSCEEQIHTNVDDAFLTNANNDDYCFVENEKLLPCQDKIDQLIVYKWNRKYPADFKLDLDLKEWKLIESVDFTGKSHEKITRETYAQS